MERIVFKPTIYQKSIYDINYNALKKQNIKVLVFDLDNTLALIDENKCPSKSKKLIQELKKDFQIFIISNNTSARIKPYVAELGIEGVPNARKPFTKGLKKIVKKGYKKEEMVMIGDQLVTDVLSGNRFHIKTILVDPLGKKDLKITAFNRLVERQIFKFYKRKNILERGRYYE